MKNLLKTRRTKIYFGIITSAVFAMAIALFANFKPSLFRNASAVNDYTITFNRDNGGTGFPSSYGSGTNSNGHTSRGNPISFTYNNAKSTSSKFCTLASGGYLYNSTVLTGLESVNVTFSGGSLSLLSSKSTTFSGDAQSLTSGSALTIAANYDYFKLVASGETVIESITVYYTCSARPESSTVTDVITAADLKAETTSYVDFSGVTKNSDAVYAGNSAKDTSGNIQLRSKNSNSGLVTTISGGTVSSVKITVGNGSNTINVYGSNTAYESASDLFGSAGTLVGSLSSTGTVNFTGDNANFAYVGLRSNSGAVYISSIEITWSTSGGGGGGGDTPTPQPETEIYSVTIQKSNTGLTTTASTSTLDRTYTLSDDTTEIGVTFGSGAYNMSNYDEFRLNKNSYLQSNSSDVLKYMTVDYYGSGYNYVTITAGDTEVSAETSSATGSGTVYDYQINSSDWKILASGGYSTFFSITLYYEVSVGPIAVQSVSLDKTAAEITNEGGVQLTASISPSNATNKSVTWSTSNGNIATVSELGYVTGVAAGTATITVTTADGSFTATCTVTVTAVVHVESVSLNTNALALHPGENSSLTATVLPANASNKNVTWSTSNASYATVNNGSVTAVAAGTATITVTTEDGSKTATCTVTVTNIAVTGISLNKNSLTLTRTNSETLTATIAPANASNKNVNWSSGNTNVATVSGGTVTAVGTGTTTIYAKSAENASIQATCTVTVNPVNVTSVSLDKNALSLTVGGSETLTATVSPSNADNTSVNWSTSDSSVATVSSGTVSAVAAGTATITATSAADSSKKATCTVTVTSQSPVSSYTIEFKVGTGDGSTLSTSTENSTYIESGSEYVNSISSTNKAYGAGSNGLKLGASSSAGSLTLSIDSTEVSTIVVNAKLYRSDKSATLNVNSAGAQSVGLSFTDYTYTINDTITSITLESTKYIWISGVTVNVKNSTPINPTAISIDPSSLELGKGGTRNLIVNYTPANANQNKEVTWDRYSGSSNISVDQNGLVTVSSNASVGNSAVIRAKLTNLTSIYAYCTVTVTDVQKAKYTVLLYLCGSTLEYGKNTYGNYQLWGSATDDMREILQANGTYKSDVNIVVETGGSKKWESTYGVSKDKLEVRHVSGSSYVKDSPSTITTQANMGEASTLQTFLEYGLTTYPADKTALILWDHGGAMTGVCCDDNYDMECLTAAEVKSAVSGALSNCGMSGQKLEWIGYDACLMGVADIASINSDYFNYMVASQESEPGDGWDYTTWVSSLYNNPTNTRTVLESITTSFKTSCNKSSDTSYAMLAAYDLSYMSAFTTAFENFAGQLTANNWSKLKTAHDNSLKFGEDEGDYFYGIADMTDFMNKVASQISSLSSYTTAVKNALGNLVFSNQYCSDYNNASVKPCGICVFMAYTSNSSYYPYTVKADYTENDTKFTKWRNYNIDNGEWSK